MIKRHKNFNADEIAGIVWKIIILALLLAAWAITAVYSAKHSEVGDPIKPIPTTESSTEETTMSYADRIKQMPISSIMVISQEWLNYQNDDYFENRYEVIGVKKLDRDRCTAEVFVTDKTIAYKSQTTCVLVDLIDALEYHDDFM